jgi:hypothetical protein
MLPYARMPLSPVGRRAGVALLAIALTVLQTYPLAFKLDRVGRLNTGDGQFSLWNIAWVAHVLTTSPDRLFNANIFYPHYNTLAYSESNILNGIVGIPVWLATKNPFATHNTVVLLGFIASFLSAYALARFLTGHRGAALLCAIAFAFSPFTFARMAHVQLLMTYGIPLALLAFHRLVDRLTPGRAAALGLAIIVQTLSCAYYGIFAALTVGLGVFYYATTRRMWKNAHYWTMILLAAGVTLIVLVPFFIPYLMLQRELLFVRTLEDATMFSADWRAWLASSSHAHQWLLGLIGRWNEVLFPGIVTSALGLTGIWLGLRAKPIVKTPKPVELPPAMLPAALRSQNDEASKASAANAAPRGEGEREPTRETTIFYVLIGVVAFWASFGPQAGLYSLLYYVVPAFSFLRAPGRFGIMVTFALAVLMAIAVRELLAKKSARTSAITIAVLGCGLVAELNVVPLILIDAEKIDPAYRYLATAPRGAVIEMPFWYRRSDYPRHAEYMLASTYHWQPLINGYSDYIPGDFREMAVPLSSFPSIEAFRYLRQRKARYAVFHWNLYDARSILRTRERIEAYGAFLKPITQTPDVWLYEITGWPDGTEVLLKR